MANIRSFQPYLKHKLPQPKNCFASFDIHTTKCTDVDVRTRVDFIIHVDNTYTSAKIICTPVHNHFVHIFPPLQKNTPKTNTASKSEAHTDTPSHMETLWCKTACVRTRKHRTPFSIGEEHERVGACNMSLMTTSTAEKKSRSGSICHHAVWERDRVSYSEITFYQTFCFSFFFWLREKFRCCGCWLVFCSKMVNIVLVHWIEFRNMPEEKRFLFVLPRLAT